MTEQYGQPIRTVRQEHCPRCDRSTDMIHVKFANEGYTDLRRCDRCDSEFEFETRVTAPPSKATLHDLW